MNGRTLTTRVGRSQYEDYRELLSLSSPVLLGALSSVVIGLTDTALIGRYDVSSLAAVAGGAAVFSLLMNVIAGAAIGHQVLAARHFGAGEPTLVGRSFVHSMLLVGTIATGCFLLVLGAARWLVRLVSDSPDVLALAVTYLQARAPEMLLFVPAYLLRTTLNAEKQTRWGMYASFIDLGVNTALAYTLIYGAGPIPELGAFGAGLAGTLAELSALSFLVVVALRRSLPSRLLAGGVSLERRGFAQLWGLGWPTMCSLTLDYVAVLVFFALAASHGTTELAASRIAFNLLTLFFVFSASLAVGSQILSGRASGVGDVTRIRRYWRRNLVLMTVLLAPLGLIVVVWPIEVGAVFTSFAEVQEGSAGAVRIAGLLVPLLVWSTNNAAVLRALGRTRWELYADVFAVWLLQLPVGWALGNLLGWGLSGIYLGFAVGWLGHAMVTYMLVVRALSLPGGQTTVAAVT
jgi:MATE family multidrug resistance protein